MSLKLVPAALLLFLAVAVGFGPTLQSAEGTVATVVTSTNQFNSGTNVGIGIAGTDDSGTLQVRAVGGTVSFNVSSCFVSAAVCAAVDTSNVNNGIDIDTDMADVNNTNEALALSLTMDASCTANITIQITVTDVNNTMSTTIDCVATSGGGGGGGQTPDSDFLDAGQVTLTALPNLLPCEGGTTTLLAEVVDPFGNTLDGAGFRFQTTAGQIVQISDDTAKLTLGPNQLTAEVTATIVDVLDEEVDTATTRVSLQCNGSPDTQVLVVTASPNVVDCTGTTTITATVRDANGHVVPGRGFHFVTSTGILTVDPNNASTEEGVATLRLRPGDGDATIAVSSGLLHGTYEELDGTEDIEDDFVADEAGMVTVQQNCLSTTTGQIKVNSSAKNVTCGESIFIGLSVIDEDIQTVIDGTPMTLIATAGGFYGGEGTLLSAAQVPTSHGEANTIYYAPANFNGEVKITAASGDAYGYEKLNITCIVAPVTGTGTTATGSGTGSAVPAQPCNSIGDGLFINPNTGAPCNPNAITPPNTGSAGLK